MNAWQYIDLKPTTSSFRADVIKGLKQKPKVLFPKYFYDARGSELFEKICELKEYYPTKTEITILDQSARELDEFIAANTVIIELGSGSNRKIKKLLQKSKKISGYAPIDISPSALQESANGLSSQYPHLKITAICADYTKLQALPREALQGFASRLIFFPGSTIGNLQPEEALALLRNARSFLDENDLFLIGFDLIKDSKVLEAAYNDQKGVTAEFNLNILRRINRELDADFQMEKFRHEAIFNRNKYRVEMHLVSTTPQKVAIGPETIHFDQGETIHTESSHKFSLDGFASLANRAGFSLVKTWTDDKDYFAEMLLRA